MPFSTPNRSIMPTQYGSFFISSHATLNKTLTAKTFGVLPWILLVRLKSGKRDDEHHQPSHMQLGVAPLGCIPSIPGRDACLQVMPTILSCHQTHLYSCVKSGTAHHLEERTDAKQQLVWKIFLPSSSMAVLFSNCIVDSCLWHSLMYPLRYSPRNQYSIVKIIATHVMSTVLCSHYLVVSWRMSQMQWNLLYCGFQ